MHHAHLFELLLLALVVLAAFKPTRARFDDRYSDGYRQAMKDLRD